mmetsp:Transcript_12043/g.17546  ORF Transcript_12043/g.17546 Transcript_12043/m.17546 type:complete len:216 (+) Transcript_12043:154-801(+)
MENLISSAIRICDLAGNQKGRTIPSNLFEICSGVAFLHTSELALLAMAHTGKGLIVRRNLETKKWSPPCAISAGGAGFGFAVGAGATDYILIFVDDSAIRHLSDKRDVTLGSNFGVKAGPIQGKDHARLDSAGLIYSYGMNKGVFAGLGMEGGVIRVKDKKNEEFYKSGTSAHDILFKEGSVDLPQETSIHYLYERIDSMFQRSSEYDIGEHSLT